MDVESSSSDLVEFFIKLRFEFNWCAYLLKCKNSAGNSFSNVDPKLPRVNLLSADFSVGNYRGNLKFRRLFGIEKDIGKAKEGIRSKRITKGSQEVRSRAPCGCTVPSGDLTCPWERFGMHFANNRTTAQSHHATARVQSQSCISVDRATARYRLTESKLRLKLEFQVFGPGPSLFEGPILTI
ncbi:hypothetical protein PIB30_062428 [Stylosanthes scabra]|uniref:Uncharacterized protein n=1 Tax=Stylosanthes scabra TaxID=79078 RepID=A0ABU6XKY9_9FABA|nr:hypothetical protein [Stylosanthes scabra]